MRLSRNPASKITSYNNASLLRGTPCATDSVRSKLPPTYVPVTPVTRLAWSKPCHSAHSASAGQRSSSETSTGNWSSYVGRGDKNGDTKKTIGGKFERNFRRPPLAEFGADAARSFADHTTGVRSRQAR